MMNRRSLFGLLVGIVFAGKGGPAEASGPPTEGPKDPIMLAETRDIAWLNCNFNNESRGGVLTEELLVKAI